MTGRYNWQREQLTKQHSRALGQIGGLYTRSLSGLFLNLAGNGPDGLIGAFTGMLPQVSQPFQMSAAQLGFQFFNMRRDMAAQNARGGAPSNKLTLDRFNLNSIASMSMSGLLAEIGVALSKGLQEGKSPEQIVPRIAQLSSSIVADVDREIVKQASDEDDFATDWVVAVSADGCSFCKSLTLDWGADGEGASFHDNCSCVIDASFKDEVKFRQEFHEDYFKDVDEARALIESGEAGERTVQVGSEEWKTQIKKELSGPARERRKGFESDWELGSEEKTRLRNATNERVEAMAEKAALVAQGKASWNGAENAHLKGWGVEMETLTTPRAVPVASFTQKNLNVAMEIVQGNRQVKQ